MYVLEFRRATRASILPPLKGWHTSLTPIPFKKIFNHNVGSRIFMFVPLIICGKLGDKQKMTHAYLLRNSTLYIYHLSGFVLIGRKQYTRKLFMIWVYFVPNFSQF